MRKKAFTRLAVFAGTLLGSLALAQQPAVLTIHADQPVSPVSPVLYGLMTEEINYSYDGGLYAEMVRNRTFHGDWSGILYWYLIENGDAAAKMEVDTTDGPSEALKTSLKLTIEKASKGNEAGLLNVGWWGYGLKPATTYTGSFYARTLQAGLGPVTVALVENATGRQVGSAKVNGISTQWKQYSFTIKTGELKPSADYHLAVTVANPGELKLQLISLFPPTYKNRPNGNRVDLMEKLAAMHPQFLRFPGGNYLEGDTIAERFDWKKTIGPLVDRPGHQGPWNYPSTDGLGLLEFLGWCEDLEMQPVLAVYGGYSLHGEHVEPGPALEPYVQDALDEIEYVAGAPDSKWGSVRMKNGHALPFKLTYVEIGNEDWFDRSGSYDGRFTQFYKAIKAKYPELKLIATAPVTSVKPDVLDEHFYVRATTNFHTANHYDPPAAGTAEPPKWDGGGRFSYADRKGPKIFVGEWATREGLPTPNMGAALGDAAWMTGLERNGDVVVMSAYAPLLVNVNPGGMQWETDLIGYNAGKSYGSPAYYAQAMFASHVGDATLKSSLTGAGEKLFYSITGSTAKKKLYLKLVNAASVEQPVHVALEGVEVASTAKLTRLTGRSTQDTNSINDPEHLVPVESTISDVTKSLDHTMLPFTVEVIEFDVK